MVLLLFLVLFQSVKRNFCDGVFLSAFYCAAFLSPSRPLGSAATLSTEAGLQVKWGFLLPNENYTENSLGIQLFFVANVL